MSNEHGRRAGPFARSTIRSSITAAAWIALVARASTAHGQQLPQPSPQCDERASWLARPVADFATRLAIARAGLQGRGPIGDVAARARATAWLPRVSARVGRGLSASSSMAGGFSSSDRASESEALSFEVRVVFALDRAFWSPIELDAERVEAQRAERRRVVERDVLDALVVLEQQRLTACLSGGTHSDANPVLLRARAQVEAATGVTLVELRRRAGH